MNGHSLKIGIGFGLTSGIITTLGLIVGLDAGTHSRLAIIGGVLTIAIADAFSDALGIHISEESENKHKVKEIWDSTISTFLAKFIVAMTFVVPMLLLPLDIAIAASVIWGLSLLGVFSFYISTKSKRKRWGVVMEHLFIASLVIIIAHYVGHWISFTFR